MILQMLGFAAWAAAADAAPAMRLALSTWGMPGEPRFKVILTESNKLAVDRESFSFSEGRLSETHFSKQLSDGESAALIEVAEAATDFEQGCGEVADGTSARLVLTTGEGQLKRECFNAASWPSGQRTRQLLALLNSHFPEEFRVF